MRRNIRANHRCGAPQLHVAVDVETRPQPADPATNETVHTLWFGKALRWRQEGREASRRVWHHFEAARQFWEWLYGGLSAKHTTWVWFHFARYDLPALQIGDELTEGRMEPAYRHRQAPEPVDEDEEPAGPEGLLCLMGPPTILDMQDAFGRRFVIVDTMNFFPMSLADLGKSVGIDKPADPGDEADEAYWHQRCEVDVRIVQAAVTKLRRWQLDNDLGNLRYTVAGQSLAAWSHGRRDCDITWGHDEYVKRLERAAYWPGKLRANYLGVVAREPAEVRGLYRNEGRLQADDKAPVCYRLDINSCYPHVMRGNAYPVGAAGTHQNVSLTQADAFLRVYEACALVTLRSRDEAYPVRTPEGISWRVGTLRTALAGPDLRHALAAGHVLHVHELNTYRRGYPFDSFVELVLRLRADAAAAGDPAFAKLAKLLGNALHGKLAQWSQGWRLIQHRRADLPWGHWCESNYETGRIRSYRSIGHHVQEQLPRTERPDSFPLIAAYVSSYARRHVQAACNVAGAHQVYYQDVDSLHVSALGFERLNAAGWVHPTEPGKFKIEATAQSATWRGPKNYCFDGVWTVSGVSPKPFHDSKGLLCQRSFHSLNTYFNGPPPAGPVTVDSPVPDPMPHIEGRIGADGWLEYPVEGA